MGFSNDIPLAANLITGFGCIVVDSVVVSDMDRDDDMLLLACVVDGATKAEAEEMKASARMLESFMIAI